MAKSYTDLLFSGQPITDDMTVAQVYERIGIDPDTDYITRGSALSEVLGGDQEFEDWLVEGMHNLAGMETVGAIRQSWEEYKEEQDELSS